MSWISYAQNGEDVLLKRALSDVAAGFWIDVGACDPVSLSLTKHFSDAGWRGINIDASPVQWKKLVAARPRDVNLNVAVSNKPGSLTFYRAVRDVTGGDASGLSTLNADEVAIHRQNGFVFEESQVPVVTLAQICADHAPPQIDFLSVDVEGHELQVLEGADFSRFRPRIVVVEATRPLSQEPTHHRWEHVLLNARYQEAWFDGLNRWYLREEDRDLLPKLQVQPNVYDDYIPWIYQRQIEALRDKLNPGRLVLRLAQRAREKMREKVRARLG